MALIALIILIHNDVKAALIPWERCRQKPKLTPKHQIQVKIVFGKQIMLGR